MPSKNKQINIRVDGETESLLPALKEAVSKSLGLNISYSDLVRLGLAELKAKYMAGEPEKPAKKK
jgi:hypothetical protein